MKLLVLLNGRSGRGRDMNALAAKIRDAAGRAHECETRLTGSKEELDEIFADPSLDRLDAVVAVGGDGTVSEVGKRLVGRGAALGIVPTGSGNGLARHLHIPMRVEAAIAQLFESTPLALDTATVNDVPFLGTFGVGFDALIAHRFAAAGTRGIETYIREGVKAFISFKAQPYEIEVDGVRCDESAFVVTIANSSQYGNDARIAPHASMRDGMLDLCVLRNARVIDAPDIIQRLFRGTLRDCAYMANRRGRRIVIRQGAESLAHVDGEPLTLPAELTIEILPRSLNVLVPRGAEELI